MTHPDTILLRCGSTVAAVPNSWHTVSTDHFLSIVESLQQLYAGLITPDELLCRYVCRVLHLSLPLIVRKHHADHLLSIARRVTFILTPDLRPRLTFARQMLPVLTLPDGTRLQAYAIGSDYSRLTCSLTALQYIEATEALNRGQAELPLLAAILYSPRPYTTAAAVTLASKTSLLPPISLLAVRFVFQALLNVIYTRTEFSLLAKFKPQPSPPISTDLTDTLYSLSADGYGTAEQVEQMNVIAFLRIMRKKTIETVKAMRQLEMAAPEIAAKTGLPIETINDIIHP